MSFYDEAPVWLERDAARHTCPFAKPNKSVSVKNARVIEVKQALYRKAEVSGYFLLADNETTTLPADGWHRVEVQCCWFGLRLKTRGPRFKVNMATAVIHKNYTGDVFANIGL
ncbi:hypothetical protein [Azonexus fungiphilus]|uniref:hypothetical protein n=1 Tax=Azonexus fungiphilus TaxID=146940 RepID=UPI00156AD219|nr:hypothetical protein [Azonexus fungiphilus]NHC08358.1 hypothetical protein [Azonexus fungiphilus]